MKQKILKFLINSTFNFRLFFDNFILINVLNLYNNKNIFDEFIDKEILIVGNGPSLKNTPLDKMRDMVCIGMNKINLLYDQIEWRPDIIVCVNGLVIRQNLDFFNTTKTPLLLPVKAFYLGVRIRKNVFFFKQVKDLIFSDDLVKGYGSGSTVTYTCLQLAAFLSATNINIVGVDHSFKFTGSNKDISKMEEDDENHFHPDYFKGKLWGNPDLEGSEVAYKKAKKYFDKKNIPIKDATIEGKLQVFEKINIKELLK